MFRLTLPSMVGGRELANILVSKFDGDLRDADVLVDAQGLVISSPSFSAELVHRVLEVEGARVLEVYRAPADFAEYLEDAAERLGLQDRLVLTRPQKLSARI